MMIKSLYDTTKDAFLNYPENPLDRKEWLFRYPAQPVITVDQIKWTEGCTDSIGKAQQGDKDAVKEYSNFMEKLIKHMVEIVRGDLNTL